MGVLVTQGVCCGFVGIVNYEDVIGGREGGINVVLRSLQLRGESGSHECALYAKDEQRGYVVL